MELRVKATDSTLTHYLLAGRMDHAGVNRIRDEFLKTVESTDGSVLLDLAKVTFIVSTGIGMLLDAARALAGKGIKLAVSNAQPMVEQSIRLAKVDTVLPLTTTNEEARSLLGVSTN